MSSFDAVVCGGGPGGSACALRLSHYGLRVLLLEKARFPRHKLCGEFLSPEALPVLRQLGAFSTIRYLAGQPAVESAWFHFPTGRSVRLALSVFNSSDPGALAISRWELDKALLNRAAEAGVVVKTMHKVLDVQKQSLRDPGGFKITTVDEATGTLSHWHAPVIVDATGRHGRLGLQNVESRRHRPGAASWAGVSIHGQAVTPGWGTDLQMFFFPGGYAGIQPLAAGVANLCLFVPSARLAALAQGLPVFLQQTLYRNPVAADYARQFAWTGPLRSTSHVNLTDAAVNRSGLIRVGDAVVTADPILGAGMTLALKSGMLAADAIGLGLAEDSDYEAMLIHYESQYHRLLAPQVQKLSLLRPVLVSGWGQRYILPRLGPILPWMARWVSGNPLPVTDARQAPFCQTVESC